MDEPLVNGQGSNGLLAKMDTFRKSDDERQQLWGDLVKLLEENHTTIRQLQDDYDNERMSRTEWQGRARQSERQLNIIKLQNVSIFYCSVAECPMLEIDSGCLEQKG